jgi:hypothetical protein
MLLQSLNVGCAVTGTQMALDGRGGFNDLDLDNKATLQSNLVKQLVRLWDWFSWLRTRPSNGLTYTQQCAFRFHTTAQMSDIDFYKSISLHCVRKDIRLFSVMNPWIHIYRSLIRYKECLHKAYNTYMKASRIADNKHMGGKAMCWGRNTLLYNVALTSWVKRKHPEAEADKGCLVTHTTSCCLDS